MLTAHGLIHLVKLCIPITTKAELIQAEQLSAKQYRRSVLEAKRHNLPIPQLAPPLRLTRTEFWWTAGPSPNIEDLPDANLNQTPFVDKTGVDGLDELALPPYTAEEFAELAPVHKWERAEGLEAAFHRARLLEEESITERRRIRRERYAADRAAAKIEREEVRAAGREGVIAQEKRRMEAMQTIKDYADKTGEDVSAWFEELQHANLGQDMPEAVPQTRPVQVSRVDGRVNLYPMWPAKKKSKLQPKNQG
jgi:hypothetical protein